MIGRLNWNGLHDATLERVELVWALGEVLVYLRADTGAVMIRALRTKRVECSRQEPWGSSVSVNEVRAPVVSPDGRGQRLELEMQSGDLLVLEADEFELARP
jgi:hypothetical protein